MENQDVLLDALETYNKDAPDTIPTILEEYLLKVASTGETKYAWSKIKKLFTDKMDVVINEFEKLMPTSEHPRYPNVENVNFENMKRRLHGSVERFDGIPFTIQRLCELITNPRKHYKRTDKFMRGVEKNLQVVSTVDPYGNKIVNEKQVRANPVYMNGIDSSNGLGPGRSDTTPLAPFLPSLNQSPSNTSPFAWFNTQISNLTESASTVAPWNFTGSPVVSPADETKTSETAPEGNRSPQDGDSNSSSSSGLSSEGESTEEIQDPPADGTTQNQQSDTKNENENENVHSKPDRDPNEEPPAKRLKEDGSPDSNEGGQGDIGEIKIQITTTAPEKTGENEAEAVSENTPNPTASLSVNQSPEEVCDRRSSGGFEVTSSAAEETKTEPHRTDSGGFEVSSSAVGENKTETSEVQSKQSTTPDSVTTEKESNGGELKQSEKMEEGSSSEADSAAELTSESDTQNDDTKSDAEAVTQSKEMDVTESLQPESSECKSNGKQEVTSSTESVESRTSNAEPFSENEAASSTPVTEDENSNQSEEMYFDACSATPEKKPPSATESAKQDNVDSSAEVESKPQESDREAEVSQTDDSEASSAEAMETN